MNRLPDVEPVLRAYLADTGDRAPDRVLADVAARISHQPRGRAWRLPWRPFMNTYAKVAVAAAALVLVAVVGYSILPRTGPGPGGQSTAVPTPTAASSPSPTAVGIRDVPNNGGRLEPGQWRFHPATAKPTLAIVADVPEGWVAADHHGLENRIATNGAPAGLAILFETPAHGVFSDPCHWDLARTGVWEQDGDVAIGATVDDLVAALRANTSYSSSTPTPVTAGTYSGQQLELRLPAELDPASCDAETGATDGNYRVMPDTIYSQGKSNIWTTSILDVAGTRLMVIVEHFPGTAADKLAEAQAIVDSFVITP